jgi:succinyl-CoA synthetase alpha subunit
MGHAGAIISGNTGTPQAKVAALNDAGVPVADTPHDIVALVQAALDRMSG